MKRAILSVTNDISTDQRVYRTSLVLQEHGYDVLVVGRRLKHSVAPDKPYRTFRFSLLFNKGFLFYAEYNLRLFFFLLFKKADLLWANDLDTLLPNFLVSKLRGKTLVYDSHEYFCYVPELISRPRVQRVWLWLEKRLVPQVKNFITVNETIAYCYETAYGIKAVVVRNIASAERAARALSEPVSKTDLNLPARPFAILQGAGINIQRGAEEAIKAMHYVDDAFLLIIGGGDAWEFLERLREKEGLEDKVILRGKVSYEQLIQYTSLASVGLSLDKPLSPNYMFSLPNKIFDYLHAGIPVLASELPEVEKIVKGYDVGETIASHDPEEIGTKIRSMMHDEEKRKRWKENIKLATQELRWEQEKLKLSALISSL